MRRPRTIPGFDDVLATERLYCRTEPGPGAPAGGAGGGGDPTPPAGDGTGGGDPAGGDGGGTPAAPADPDPGAGGGNGGGSGKGEPWDEERARRTIERQRREESAAKAEAAQERQKREALERAQMTDQEKEKADAQRLKDENDALRRQNRSAELLGRLAAREDIADPELARDALIARGIEFDEDGSPKDLDSRVESLLEAKPVLKKGETPAPGNGAGEGGGDGGAGGGNPAGGGSGAQPPNANGAAGSGGQGPPPQLTQEEVEAANKAGMAAERYATLRHGASLSEWEKGQEKPEGEGK